MTLLVHLRVLAVWRLRVTVIGVTTRTVERMDGSRILCHALWKARAVCAILRSSRCARSSWLVPDGWKLRVRWLLTRYAYCLAHLSVDRRLRRTTIVRDTLLLRMLVHLGALAFVVSLALSLLFLLLRLPFFADLLKFCAR